MKEETTIAPSIFRAVRSSFIKLGLPNPFSKLTSKAIEVSKSSAGTLAQQGKRLLAMSHCLLVAQAKVSSSTLPPPLPSHPPQPQQSKTAHVPSSASAPPTLAAIPKRLFSAMDLQGVTLRGRASAVSRNTETKETSKTTATTKQKAGSMLPFSALDLSSVRLRRKSTSKPKAIATEKKIAAGAGGGRATPLHEQLKRALQKKFLRVRTETPAATAGGGGMEAEETSECEWE